MTTGKRQTEIEDALEEQEREFRLKAVEEAVAKMMKERERAILWGLGVVGSVFVGMATLIYKYVVEHLTK